MVMDKSESTPSVGRWLGYAALIAFALLSLGPVWIALKTALTGSNALFQSAASLLPQDPALFSFQRVLGLVNPADPRLQQTGLAKVDFLRALVNSIIFTVLAVVPQIFSARSPLTRSPGSNSRAASCSSFFLWPPP